MSKDWTPEATQEKARGDFVEKAGLRMPDPRWIFNSNWMDWNLRSEKGRAHVTFELGEVEWFVYKPSVVTDGGKIKDRRGILERGRSRSWQQAVLDAEEALKELEQ